MSIPSTANDAAMLLGVGITADRDTIRDRYRRLARIYHPDANPDDDAADERMRELNAAVDLLLGSDTPTIAAIIEPQRNDRALTTRERRHEARIRDALQHLPYGIYVVGTVTPEGRPNAMVADWVMQVSFRPRIICVSFERDAASLRNLRETRQLTVSLLPESGMDLAAKFLQPTDPSKIEGRSAQFAAPDKMRGVDYTPAGACVARGRRAGVGGLVGLGGGRGAAVHSRRRAHPGALPRVRWRHGVHR